MAKRPLRILVVEDFEPFRRYLYSRWGELGFEVVASTGDGMEAIELARQHQPDVACMDIGIARINGLQSAAQILTVSPHTRILFISQQSAPEIVDAALSIGHGYLLKSDSERELMNAVDAVFAGQKFRSASVQR